MSRQNEQKRTMATLPRNIKNPGKPRRYSGAREELEAALTSILGEAPPTSPAISTSSFDGLYAGPSSTAYLLYRLSRLYKDMRIKGHALTDIAVAYMQASSSLRRVNPGPAYCGIANEKVTYLTLQALLGDDRSAANVVAEVCSFADNILSTNDPQHCSNEWLYGRAGYLYLLRLLREDLQNQPTGSKRLLKQTINSVVDAILASPIPWTWHGKTYIGAAHGTMGIITQLVLTSPETASRLEPHLSELLHLQLPSGNFPARLPVQDEKLCQFCHGAPGIVASLISLRPYYTRSHIREDIDNAIAAGRKLIWETGLLSKLPCLCHGISGNAIVFDKESQVETFLSFTTSEVLEEVEFAGGETGIDEYLGLFTGEAGRAWAWAVLDQGLTGSVIGYNDV